VFDYCLVDKFIFLIFVLFYRYEKRSSRPGPVKISLLLRYFLYIPPTSHIFHLIALHSLLFQGHFVPSPSPIFIPSDPCNDKILISRFRLSALYAPFDYAFYLLSFLKRLSCMPSEVTTRSVMSTDFSPSDHLSILLLAPLFHIFHCAKRPKRADRQSLHVFAEGDAFTTGIKDYTPVKTRAQ
jgi:hypothetical protein